MKLGQHSLGNLPPTDNALTERERDELMDGVARTIVDRGMAAAAVFLLESSKPLSFLTSQAMIVFEPAAQAMFDTQTYTRFQRLLEERENVERLILRIEQREDERLARIRERKLQEREARKRRKRAREGSNDGR